MSGVSNGGNLYVSELNQTVSLSYTANGSVSVSSSDYSIVNVWVNTWNNTINVTPSGYGSAVITVQDNSGQTYSFTVIAQEKTDDLLLGDADMNDVVDARDASLVLTYYAKASVGQAEPMSDIQEKVSDVDENGVVDGRDASTILSYYAYLSTHKDSTITMQQYRAMK